MKTAATSVTMVRWQYNHVPLLVSESSGVRFLCLVSAGETHFGYFEVNVFLPYIGNHR